MTSARVVFVGNRKGDWTGGRSKGGGKFMKVRRRLLFAFVGETLSRHLKGKGHYFGRNG